jgi:serine/threonine protein kinase
MQFPNEVGGWTIDNALGAGKSASVFRATQGDRVAALKIFDPYIVEKYGKDAQLARVQRELSLRELHHPHLVRIIDGGECPTSGLLFVVMELIPAPNLAMVLPERATESNLANDRANCLSSPLLRGASTRPSGHQTRQRGDQP